MDAGQVAVEDDHVVAVVAGQAEGGGPVVGDVDGHALAAQAAGDGVGHDRRSSTTSSLMAASSHVRHKDWGKSSRFYAGFIRCCTTPPDGRATGRRDMTRRYWRAGGLAVFAALAAGGLAACGGSSSPHVASLGNSDGSPSVSTTTLPKGNPTQLLDEWASCERANGVPDMADPTITSSGAIHIQMPADASSNAAQSIEPAAAAVRATAT